MSSLLLVGCASAPVTRTAPDLAALPADITGLPQVTLADGTAAEAKALAMGAARSKGWTVSSSQTNQLTAQRPINTNILPGAAVAPGSTLEVTSFFISQPGGTKVATKAEIISPALGGNPATRIDYTDNLRAPLTQSLEALRTSWGSNRDRLARATPPKDGWADPWAGTPYARTKPKPRTETTDVAAAAAPAATPQPQPAPTTVAQQTPAARPTTSPSDVGPTPEPKRRPAAPAPVVDASSGLDTRLTTDAPLYPSASKNMMALPASQMATVASVSWSAYAEQYARQRGCQVSGGGSQLIESRQDGEVHKVPCEGSDSFLVKCQNGTCQGLL